MARPGYLDNPSHWQYLPQATPGCGVRSNREGALRKKLAALGFSALVIVGAAAPALAAPPGPGDKQCVPGKNAQPQPGKKGGTCPGRK
jgi:hypothetical protein